MTAMTGTTKLQADTDNAGKISHYALLFGRLMMP